MKLALAAVFFLEATCNSSDAYKKNDLCAYQAKVVILECDINNFAVLYSTPNEIPSILLFS